MRHIVHDVVPWTGRAGVAPMRQADGRTGTACACEAEARWDPERKQSRHGRRRLVCSVMLF